MEINTVEQLEAALKTLDDAKIIESLFKYRAFQAAKRIGYDVKNVRVTVSSGNVCIRVYEYGPFDDTELACEFNTPLHHFINEDILWDEWNEANQAAKEEKEKAQKEQEQKRQEAHEREILERLKAKYEAK
jgi:hypothetical protein